MPRGKKPQYVLADDGAGGLGPVAVDGGDRGVPGVPGVPQSSLGDTTPTAILQWLDSRTDGWFRLIPAGDGKQGYAKWKFTSGQWRGYYVMYVGPAGDVSGRLLGLAHKLGQVDRGDRRPAKDSYGGDGWESA